MLTTEQETNNRVILVPLDSSEASTRAVNWVKVGLLRQNDTIILLACYTNASKKIPVVVGGGRDEINSKMNAEYAQNCAQLLDECEAGIFVVFYSRVTDAGNQDLENC